jgi:hypothetical protein
MYSLAYGHWAHHFVDTVLANLGFIEVNAVLSAREKSAISTNKYSLVCCFVSFLNKGKRLVSIGSISPG